MTEEATRKVLMSPEFMAEWATRDDRGNLIRWDWRRPDADGWWEPVITTDYADNLIAADRASLIAAVEGLDAIQPTGYPEPVPNLVRRAAVLAILREPRP